jgi:hypothetical protein
MLRIPEVLIYQVARYEPRVILTLEVVNKSLKHKVSRDPDHIRWLHEDLYSNNNTRTLSFQDCKALLRQFSDVFCLIANSYNIKKVNLIDLTFTTKTIENFGLNFSCTNAVNLDNHWLFICGGMNSSTNAFIYDYNQEIFQDLDKMPHGHGNHGLTKLYSSVYVFGGYIQGNIASCCVYRLKENRWEDLPDLPIEMQTVTSDAYGQMIYLVGASCSELVTYNPNRNVFDIV